jgi:hypothetical protein
MRRNNITKVELNFEDYSKLWGNEKESSVALRFCRDHKDDPDVASRIVDDKDLFTYCYTVRNDIEMAKQIRTVAWKRRYKALFGYYPN